MKLENQMNMTVISKSSNESFSRAAVSAFVAQLDPTIEEISDIKTAVSEAVTNCIVHAYNNSLGKIYITVQLYDDRTVKIKIKDKGCGINDIDLAMQPMYSSLGGERAGLGFAVMQSFTDKLKVSSKVDKGTVVTLTKKLSYRVSK
ncbi:MAG: anti-sigma F factor [Acutalibacteraceae bacterium]|nr:anti-sigma F factor [Acutalibacteraceae bacterium]